MPQSTDRVHVCRQRDAVDDGVIALYRRHLERRHLRPLSIYQLTCTLRAFSKSTPLLSATKADVESFLDSRDIGARTRYRWLSALHGFYKWALTEDLATDDPTRKIIRPRVRVGLPRPIAEDDLELAISAAEQPMRTWLILGGWAGLRCAEMASLEGEAVLWDAGVLRIDGKGDKDRMVPIHSHVSAALREHGVPEHGSVFRKRNGSAWRPARVSRLIAAHFDDLGIDATAHQLRHRFGTAVYQRCRDLRVTQELLGHASPATTAIYTAVSHEAAIAAVRAL